MSLSQLAIIEDYHSLEVSRTIYPNYKCNCTKYWTGEDIFLIYKATKDNIEKIFESKEDAIKNIDNTIDLIKNVSDNVIISGGHTVINLKDRYHLSNQVLNSVDFTFRLIANLQQKYNKNAEFLVMLNDFYMEKDAGTDEGLENKYRRAALNPYIIPPQINDFLIRYSKKLNRKMNFYYCSEKNMADRFKRHIKNKKENSELFIKDKNGDYYMVIGKDKFKVLTNNKPNCVAGNAATFRSIRYKIDSNKIKDNFSSYVGIFPLCSLDNVLNGYKAANAFYEDLDLPSYLMFFGKSCF